MERDGAELPPAMRKPSSRDSETFLLRIESFALALIPWFLFTSVLTASSFVCHQFQLSSALVAGVAAAIAGLMALIGIAARDRALLALGLLCLSAVSMSSGIGLYISERWTYEYFHIVQGATYEKLSAHSHAGKLADASVLIFDQDVGVNVEQTIGFRHWGQTFCVAPIVGLHEDEDEGEETPGVAFSSRSPVRRNSASSPLLLAANRPKEGPRDVQFWAVGMGCCGARGDFHCDSALSPKAHSAVVLAEQADGYKQAVRMAGPIYGLTTVPGAVFVQWVDSPLRFRVDLLTGATCGVGVAILMHLVVSVPAGIAISRSLALRNIHA